MPDLTEQFNQRRMNRCTTVWRAISENGRKTEAFEYKVVCTEPLAGKTLEQLGKLYFSVGVGNDLTDLPLIDMLVVFSLIASKGRQLRQHKDPKDFKLELQVKMARINFTEDEVFSMLNCIRINVQPETR